MNQQIHYFFPSDSFKLEEMLNKLSGFIVLTDEDKKLILSIKPIDLLTNRPEVNVLNFMYWVEKYYHLINNHSFSAMLKLQSELISSENFLRNELIKFEINSDEVDKLYGKLFEAVQKRSPRNNFNGLDT